MELLLALIYVSFCIAIFKIFRIPVNQWSLSTAVLGGIIGISLTLLVMNYNHPFTANARIYFAVTPILPTVKGRVVEVPVQANAPLKEGDVLFRLDPKPFEYVVAQEKAALAEAEQSVKQLKASFDQAAAQAESAMRSCSWLNRTMIAKPSCSKKTLCPKQPSIPPPAISMLRNRALRRPKLKRSARGLPTRQT